MRYRLFSIAFLVAFAATPGAATADNSRYRVELIVLTHLGHDEQPRLAPWLEDFSGALDFLTPPAEADTSSATPTETPPAPDSGTGEADQRSAVPDAATDPWNVVVHVPELGERMQDVWRRLRLSEPFRPLQYLAWEQGGNAPFPTLRVHDLDIILTAETGAAGPADEAPPPIRHHRLDGTASLTRSRFLHLSIVVELREPVYEGVIPTGAAAGSNVAPGASLDSATDAPEQAAPTGFLLHRLEQSRAIRTERMEYFDGPVLGVLVWVTDISDTVMQEQTE